MKNTQRQYSDGDVIFREGEASTCVFVIVEGRVRLTKADGKETVRLAVLGPGEIFGEMGILDNGARSASAEAEGDVNVAVISREDFIHGLQDQPDMAMAVMRGMAQRLRQSGQMVVRGATREKNEGKEKPQCGFKGAGSMGSRLLDWLFGGDRPHRPRALQLRASYLAGDEEGHRQARHMVAALGRQKGFKIRLMKKILATGTTPPAGREFAAATATARAWLGQAGADLLIWGEAQNTEPSITLRFVAAIAEDADRPGDFDPSLPLCLPMNFPVELAPVVAAIALAAAAPREPGKILGRRKALLRALEAATPIVHDLPQDLTSVERATVQLCFGNAAATASVLQGSSGLFRLSAQLYRSALANLTGSGQAELRAIALKQNGAVLQALADAHGDRQLMEAAADSYQAALKVLTLEEFPQEWATTQARLGVTLYKLFLKENDTQLLKRALAAFQDSLQVFTRATTPFRWAEIMNNFAQAAQHLGEEMRNAEVLEKACGACRASLEVRTRADAPMLWAQTQNTLGSALFFLGKMSGETGHLLAAAYAIGQAHDYYVDIGAGKLAAVARKNLARLEPLLDRPEKPQVPEMKWELEAGETTAR